MNILCIIPPVIPSYFNAGHHLPIFQLGAYLRKHLPEDTITCLDYSALNATWKDVCDMLIKKFDVIVIFNDFDAVDTFGRFMYYKSSLYPYSKVITFGRLSKQIPHFFLRLGIDAVHHSGDYEPGVLSYILYLKARRTSVVGIATLDNIPSAEGITLTANEWVLPEVQEIPYKDYNRLYKNDLNKFCGIPTKQELVVPIARGCPIGCTYCDVHIMQGKTERRLSIEKTIEYIQKSFEELPFEYISFYAPTFTLDRKWVINFCNELIKKEIKYPWKCVTVLKLLDEELLNLMSKSGCIRISLGIESFTKTAFMGLPKVKQDTLDSFKNISQLCKKYNIELNCFIILGLPGDTPLDIKKTIDICLQHGARVRPTIYTPYEKLEEPTSIEEINKFNRQLFLPELMTKEEAFEYYQIFYNNKNDTKTKVMENIPARINKIIER